MVKIFIGNLAEETTEDELQALFQEYGEVTESVVVSNYGFIHMSNEKAADEAIENLNNYDLHGKQMSVCHSHGRKKDSSKRSGGPMRRNRGPAEVAPYLTRGPAMRSGRGIHLSPMEIAYRPRSWEVIDPYMVRGSVAVRSPYPPRGRGVPVDIRSRVPKSSVRGMPRGPAYCASPAEYGYIADPLSYEYYGAPIADPDVGVISPLDYDYYGEMGYDAYGSLTDPTYYGYDYAYDYATEPAYVTSVSRGNGVKRRPYGRS